MAWENNILGPSKNPNGRKSLRMASNGLRMAARMAIFFIVILTHTLCRTCILQHTSIAICAQASCAMAPNAKANAKAKAKAKAKAQRPRRVLRQRQLRAANERQKGS